MYGSPEVSTQQPGGAGTEVKPGDILRPGGDMKFYRSRGWRKKRAEILKRDRNECQRCKRDGLYTKADCVHHIKHLKKHPELALHDINLISLCNSCHDKEHPEKLGHEVQFMNEEWF